MLLLVDFGELRSVALTEAIGAVNVFAVSKFGITAVTNNCSKQSGGNTDQAERRHKAMLTFPATGNHCPKLYCLVTKTHVCEQLAQGCYVKVERPEVDGVACR